MKKILTTVFVIIFTLLVAFICFLVNATMSWSSQLDNKTHYDLNTHPAAYGEAAPRFYTDTGLCYEAVDVPEGITRDMLTKGLSWNDYDEIVTSEGGTEYRLYRDPLQTGENYVLLVPAVGGFNPPLVTVARPFGYYAKEVPKA